MQFCVVGAGDRSDKVVLEDVPDTGAGVFWVSTAVDKAPRISLLNSTVCPLNDSFLSFIWSESGGLGRSRTGSLVESNRWNECLSGTRTLHCLSISCIWRFMRVGRPCCYSLRMVSAIICSSHRIPFKPESCSQYLSNKSRLDWRNSGSLCNCAHPKAALRLGIR